MERKQMTVQLVRQREVYDLSISLSMQIRENGYQPDLIVGIARGGLVPARYLCDFLDIDTLAGIKVKHYDAGSKKRSRATLEQPLSFDITEKKVLLVDDVNDTGETLQQAHEHLVSKSPDTLMSAVLHQKTTTQFHADFFEDEITEWRWIIYPWARVEDLSEFAKQVMDAADSLADLQKQLNKRHDMDVREEDLALLQKLGKLSFS